MGECSTSQFVQLSKRIFVPQEWPIKGIETFLLKIAKPIIDDVPSDNFIIFQVHNIPTVLMQDETKHETRYFFKTISRPLQIDAYVIDVVFGKNDMSSNSVESEDSTTNEISLNDYVIITRQSDNRTTYCLIAAKENVRAVSPEIRTDFEAQQFSAQLANSRATDILLRDILLLLAAVAIASLVYTIVMSKIPD